MPPNPEVARLNYSIAEANRHRQWVQNELQTRFTPYARQDIISEIRYCESNINEFRQNENQLRNIERNSRDAREQEQIKRRREKLQDNMSSMKGRLERGKKRLDHYDDNHRKRNQELKAVDGKIRDLHGRLQQAMRQHR